MKFFKPSPLTISTSNISENEKADGTSYFVYSLASGYNKGTVVKKDMGTFEALTTIYPLAHYVWEDLITSDKHAYDLHNGVDIYPVAGQVLISITSGVTVVYVRSLGAYYIAKTTGTVDFMAENPSTPSNFNLVTASPPPYRNERAEPKVESDTIWWGYAGPANKYAVLDRAIGTRSYKSGGGTLDFSFTCNAVSAIALLFLDATDATITVYDSINPASPIQLFTETVSFADLTPLDTYEKVCTWAVPRKSAYVSFFQARYSMRIDISLSNTGGDTGVGAVKVGSVDYLGETKDGVSVNLKSYNTVTQRSNGEYVWNADNKESNKVFNLRYNLSLDTPNFDTASLKLKSLNDSEVVLMGDDADPQGYDLLINYGVVKNVDATLLSNSTKSPASIEIENFT